MLDDNDGRWTTCWLSYAWLEKALGMVWWMANPRTDSWAPAARYGSFQNPIAVELNQLIWHSDKSCVICSENFRGAFEPEFGVYVHPRCVQSQLVNIYYLKRAASARETFLTCRSGGSTAPDTLTGLTLGHSIHTQASGGTVTPDSRSARPLWSSGPWLTQSTQRGRGNRVERRKRLRIGAYDKKPASSPPTPGRWHSRFCWNNKIRRWRRQWKFRREIIWACWLFQSVLCHVWRKRHMRPFGRQRFPTIRSMPPKFWRGSFKDRTTYRASRTSPLRTRAPNPMNCPGWEPS